MQIPETDNIHFQYAFKKGYRLALDGKSMSSMPSAIRRDMEMRDYFQQGWEQAEADIAQGLLSNSQSCWRCRFVWGTVMILGGAATAYSIIHSYEVEQAELAAQHQSRIEQAALKNIDEEPDLEVLSANQRLDLAANLAEIAQRPEPLPPVEAVIQSDIKVPIALFTSQVKEREATDEFSEFVPKYIRELYFYTHIDFADQQTIYHRWRFNNQYLATIPLKISSQHYRTWSSKKMSSAWQGQWDVEVLNEQHEVIYRKTFTYGTQR